MYLDVPSGGYVIDASAGEEVHIAARIEEDESSKHEIVACAGIGSVEIE